MKNKLSIFAALCALAVLITASPQVMASAREGLRLCGELILPSLFPFFVVSSLLRRLGLPARLGRHLEPVMRRCFHASGLGASALLMGLTGGYPLGAACVAELLRTGQLRREEAEKLLTFCNNTGPAFLVGAIGGGVFRSSRLGLALYGIHALSALLTGFILRARESRPPASSAPLIHPETSLSQALPGAVADSVPAVLSVCGFVVCFTVFTALLDANGFLTAATALLSARTGLERSWLRALLCGFFELGSGVGALRGMATTPLNLALSAAMVGWGGLSVLFQTMAQFADLDVKSAPHWAGRFLSACFSFVLAYGLGCLLKM